LRTGFPFAFLSSVAPTQHVTPEDRIIPYLFLPTARYFRIARQDVAAYRLACSLPLLMHSIVLRPSAKPDGYPHQLSITRTKVQP